MGVAKKEKSRKERQGKVGDGMNNVKVKGENFYRYSLGLTIGYSRGKIEKLSQFLTINTDRRKRSKP